MIGLDRDEILEIVDKVLNISDKVHRIICAVALTIPGLRTFKLRLQNVILHEPYGDIFGEEHMKYNMYIVDQYSEKFGCILYGLYNQIIDRKDRRSVSIRISQQVSEYKPIPKRPSGYEEGFDRFVIGLPIFYTGDNTCFNGTKNNKRPDFICLDSRGLWFIIELFATYYKLKSGKGEYNTISDYLYERANEFEMSVLSFDELIFRDIKSDSIKKSFVRFLLDIHFDANVHLEESFVSRSD